jgi:hypothetical protein
MAAVGIKMPSFEFLQSLTGSLTMFTALSMPPYAYWRMQGETLSKLHKVWLWFVLVFGIVCTVFSTVYTVSNQMSTFHCDSTGGQQGPRRTGSGSGELYLGTEES